MKIISPSLLSANFMNISKDIRSLEKAGVKRLHLDVMDGHFVPSLTFGSIVIKSIRQATSCHLETHLMIKNPHKSIDQYIKSGSDTIIIHLEASTDPKRDLEYIRNKKVKAGIAINPDTDENLLTPLLDYLDYILVMSVFPGKGGQEFLSSTLSKMKNIVSMREKRKFIIGVDGGVNMDTIATVFSTNIDVAIVGSGIFKSSDFYKRFQELMNA